VAKAKTLEHPKTLDLADALGIMDCFALGIMEAFWHHVAAYYADGEITGMKPTVMARSIRYTGNAQELLEAIVQAGFVDRVGDRLIVHGWPEHCNDSVHMALARAHKHFADGTTPRTSRLSNKERERIEAWFQAHPVRTESAQEAHETPEKGDFEPCAQEAHVVRTTIPSHTIYSVTNVTGETEDEQEPEPIEPEIIEPEVISADPFPTVERILTAVSAGTNQPPPTRSMITRYIGKSSPILRLVEAYGESDATRLIVWCSRYRPKLGYPAVFGSAQNLWSEASRCGWGDPDARRPQGGQPSSNQRMSDLAEALSLPGGAA